MRIGKPKNTDGRKDRREERRTWTSDVTDWCGLSYTKCVRTAEVRTHVKCFTTFLSEPATSIHVRTMLSHRAAFIRESRAQINI